MNTISTRIKKIIQLKDLNYRKLAKLTNYSDVAVRKIVLGQASPKFDFIERIKRIFPDINSEWLLTGNGEVLIDTEEKMHSGSPYEKIESDLNDVKHKIDYIYQILMEQKENNNAI